MHGRGTTYEGRLEVDDPGLHDYGFRVPRWIVRLYHEFLRHLNPRFDDDGHCLLPRGHISMTGAGRFLPRLGPFVLFFVRHQANFVLLEGPLRLFHWCLLGRTAAARSATRSAATGRLFCRF